MNWRVSFCLLPTALAPLNAQKYHMQQKVVVSARCRLFCCTLHHVPDLRKSFGIFIFFETTKTFTSLIKPVLLQSRTQLGSSTWLLKRERESSRNSLTTFVPQCLLECALVWFEIANHI